MARLLHYHGREGRDLQWKERVIFDVSHAIDLDRSHDFESETACDMELLPGGTRK
jgi:hypothetical protein